jgi:4-amino-4-deoxy-L-arabinose transferase-like glycosyltransferase
MNHNNIKLKALFQKQHIFFPILLFIWAFLLRQYFFCGFIMGDDGIELPALQQIIDHGPIFTDQIFRRFMGWLLNFIFFKLFGVSEISYFLPTWLLSSSLSLIGYAILLNRGYSLRSAMFAGLMIASAPYEILTGAVRMNDLILSWFMIIAFWALLFFKRRTIIQGIIIAVCLWSGFYTKLWVVYIFPLFFLYYGWQIIKYKKWNGFISFLICSFILHGGISIFWKIKIGSFLPFIQTHAANYPVAAKQLSYVFGLYPHMIFQGSEFDTTLFGAVPYLLVIVLFTKLMLNIFLPKKNKIHWNSLDFWLFFYYMSFFLLLNFFPNAFVFDKFYSVPRIFRYITPISFPMTLHLAKLIIDICSLLHKHVKIYKWTMSITFCLLIGLNIYHTAEATRPGRTYRKNLKLVIQEIKQNPPPAVLTESWLSCYIKRVYLKSQEDKTQILRELRIHSIKEHEAWLNENESTLPEGTILLTGLASYVFYGAHYNGFRLSQFENKLSPAWKMYKEFGTLDYLPIPEKVILWKLSHR